jgi:hypothetical protein
MLRNAGFLAVGTIVLTLTTWLGADEPAKPAKPPARSTKDELDKVIKQLGDESFKIRAGALKTLENLGPEVLPVLKDAFRKADDPEVRRRIEERLPTLEHAAALSPTKINLTFKDKPVKDVFAELAKQSGYKFEVYPQGDDRERKQISLELKDVPFWQALDKVCETCGVFFQEGWYGNDQMSLRFEYGEANLGFVHFDGPFRTSVRGFNYQRNLDFANGQRRAAAQGQQGQQPVQATEYLHMNLSVSVEPKLPILSAGQVTITEAIDDKDQSMAPPTNNNMYQSYYHGYRSYTQQVQAQLMPKGGTKLKKLKGTISITAISAQREKITVEKIVDVKNQTYKAGSITLNVESVTKVGDDYEIKLGVTEGGAKNDNLRMNTYGQRFALLDDKGNKYYGYASSWRGMNNGGSGSMRFTPNGQTLGDPVRLVFYEWTTVTHAVPFEFKDLPLP